MRRERTLIFSILGLLAWIAIGSAWTIIATGTEVAPWMATCFVACSMAVEHGLIGYFWEGITKRDTKRNL